jgi:hypothetical protein
MIWSISYLVHATLSLLVLIQAGNISLWASWDELRELNNSFDSIVVDRNCLSKVKLEFMISSLRSCAKIS